VRLTDIQGWPLGESLLPSVLGWPLGRPVGDDSEPPVKDDMLLWLDGADADSLTVTGGVIDQWNDKSGFGYHAVASGTGRPAYGSRSLNGIQVPDFDGSNDSFTSTVPFGTRPCTTFVVGQKDDNSFNDLIGARPNGNQLRLNGSNQVETVKSFSGIVSTFDASSISSGVTFVICQRLSPSSIMYRLNGITETDSESTTMQAATCYIGTDTSEFYNGMMAEIIVYSRALSDEEVESVMQYLKHKWGGA
jgi:hypothetical protein